MYGIIPKAKIDALLNAPPAKILIKSIIPPPVPPALAASRAVESTPGKTT